MSISHGAFKNLQRWISSIGQSSTTAINANTDSTNQIAHPDQYARPEQGIACERVAATVYGIRRDRCELRGEDNGHDNSVDCHDFTEDDGDQVLRPYAWRLDTSS